MNVSNEKRIALTEYFDSLLREANTKEEMTEILADIILALRDSCYDMTDIEKRVDNLDFFDGVKFCYAREVDRLIEIIKTQKEGD